MGRASGPGASLALRCRWGIGCAMVVTALAACRAGGVRECTGLLEAKQHEPAARRCAQAFAETGDPRAGAAAARALDALGRDEEALAWVERLRQTEEEPDLLSLAAGIHRRRGEKDLARRAMERQLQLARAAGDHSRAAKCYYWLYYGSWEQSDFRRALEFARLSAQEAAEARAPEQEARAFEALFSLLLDIGDLDGARQALERALELTAPEDRARRSRLLVNEGLVRMDEGRPALARQAYARALELTEGSEGRRFLRSVYLNIVEADLAVGDLDGAERHLGEAWTHAEPDGSMRTVLLAFDGQVLAARGRYAAAADALRTALGQQPVAEWAWQIEYHAGSVAEAGGDLLSAERHYERAIGIVEEMRRSLQLDEFKTWLLDRKRRPHEAVFRLYARSGRSRAALQAAERAKARSFLDAFVHAATTRVAPSEGPGSAAAADQVESLQALLPALGESPVVALRPVDRLLEALETRHVLAYFNAGDDLWLVSVAGRRVRTRLAAPSAEVRDLVSRLLARPDGADVAFRLGELLLPAGSLPPRGGAVYVVTDGPLGQLPFGLIRHQGRYLAEDYVISYVPSLNALAAIEERRQERPAEPLVLGDPLGDLPGATREAREVAGLLGVPAFTGGAATIEQLRRASTARVLHLATHSGLGPRGPWLALADGRVDAQAVLAARIRPGLVVLATCASAARRDKGMWSALGGAFLAAGTGAVLASLWSIEDEPARRFVRHFYAEGGATDPAGALARAQRASIAQGESPRLWAPFVLFGSRPSPPGPDRSTAGR